MKQEYIQQRIPELLAEVEADKERRNLKNTKPTRSDEEKAKNVALGEWTRIDFDRRVKEQHPDDWLTHDPVWNPKHPLYKQVNALIERKGLSAPEAIRRAEESEIVVIPAYVATEKQVSFAGNLLDEREAPSGYKVVDVEDEFSDVVYKGRNKPETVITLDGKILGKRDASELIDKLLKAPRKQTASSDADAPVDGLDLSDLPAGTYAVPNGETRLKVRVEQGKPGTRWEGWTFVKDAAAYGQRTRYGMQKPGQPYRGKIENELAAILDDPVAAVKAYGSLTGKCAMCNRKLEDERSVELGIGPICEAKNPLF